ncbi:hypothetical protein B0H16DRAFT_1898627 [Mycena metata]|uniref:Uncharacterized protein n=1 Tax=Mycena metata TaxID=1033252 RepID=A0AAD7MGE0_9AGAR|nr:hypothetical protein B0H16DRAFT_1898627 [Mycena metata]
MPGSFPSCALLWSTRIPAADCPLRTSHVALVAVMPSCMSGYKSFAAFLYRTVPGLSGTRRSMPCIFHSQFSSSLPFRDR